jgi:serine/threonine protein kinase
MKVTCHCTQCGATFAVDEATPGQSVACPVCGKPLALQGLAENAAAPEPIPDVSGETPPSQPLDATVPWPAAEPAEPMPTSVGRFVVRGRLGSGSFGAVYRAYDPLLDREVALKVPKTGRNYSEEGRARMLREAKAAAQFRHPNIVPLYDAGFDGERFFMASALIEGETLAQTIERQPPNFGRAAEIVARLAAALHYAHQRGVIHRDVKPSNVLIDSEGHPLLTDFGMARLEESASLLTRAGAVFGTPAYMSPEQASGKQDQIGPASDQYSLGVVLYQLLCGRVPFSGTTWEVIASVISGTPPSLRSLNKAIPPELEAICVKAMSKLPAERYESCQALADDLERWSAGQSTAAQQPGRSSPPSAWDRCRGNPIRTAAVIGGVLVLLLVLAVALRIPAGPKEIGGKDTTQRSKQSASIDVLLWDSHDKARRRMSLGQPGAVPLSSDDVVRIEAHVEPPMYVYLVWVDSQGKATPVYPWQRCRWSLRPAKEAPVGSLRLPEEADEGWPMQATQGGMETLVLLAREEPLGRDVDVERLFSDLPKQPMQDRRALVWFAEGQPIKKAEDAQRAPNFFKTTQIDDPLLRMQRLLHDRLGRQFSVQRAVSFATVGKEQ